MQDETRKNARSLEREYGHGLRGHRLVVERAYARSRGGHSALGVFTTNGMVGCALADSKGVGVAEFRNMLVETVRIARAGEATLFSDERRAGQISASTLLAIDERRALDPASSISPPSPHLGEFPLAQSILVLDSAVVHWFPGMQDLVGSIGACLIYPPTYSYDFSPIEVAFSKVKVTVMRYRDFGRCE